MRIKKYDYKTPDLCKALGLSRMTLWNWEQKGIFTPPRNLHGDRVFTKVQYNQILRAFSPEGVRYWHFSPDATTSDDLVDELSND